MMMDYRCPPQQVQGVTVCVLLATLDGAARSLKGEKVNKSK